MMIDYWRQGRFPFDRLIQTYAFEQIGQAFHDIEEGNVIKPVLLVSAP
jgi:aryl-alcohol dehydrogenase